MIGNRRTDPRIRQGRFNGLAAIALTLACLLITSGVALAAEGDEPKDDAADIASSMFRPTESAPEPEPVTEEIATKVADEPNPEVLPRFEARISSWQNLLSEAKRSHVGAFLEFGRRLLWESGTSSSEGVDINELKNLLESMIAWPDASIELATFAADREGRARWGIRINWPIQDLHDRLAQVLQIEGANELFEKVRLEALEQGGFELSVADQPLAHLYADGTDHSIVGSHEGLALESDFFAEADGVEPSYLLECRLNLGQTEKDSGATFMSTFRAVAWVYYRARVTDGGDWIESAKAGWPPLVGMGGKTFVDKVDEKFFVPDDAFGNAVFKSMIMPSMIDGMAGFGPQVMLQPSGDFTMVQPSEMGPITTYADSNACVSVLPGKGVFGAPDVVMQMRLSDADKFIEHARRAMKEINTTFVKGEQEAPWHEVGVRGRPLFWKQAPGMGSMFMPFVYRPVVFVSKEFDEDYKQHDVLVVAMTSGSVEAIAERWLDYKRDLSSPKFPVLEKTYGLARLNWNNVYRWLLPQANVLLSAMGHDALLPSMEDVSGDMTPGIATLKVGFDGLTVSHRGPIPMGTIVVPSLFVSSLRDSAAPNSDIARERLAAQRLKVLYHHARLFHKDLGRWPAELAELDGYVDFQGNPGLLRLEKSAKQQRTSFFESMFGIADSRVEEVEDEDEDGDDSLVKINDELFVIDWHPDSWTLGFKPGTLEHLEALYIDQDGMIHRQKSGTQ